MGSGPFLNSGPHVPEPSDPRAQQQWARSPRAFGPGHKRIREASGVAAELTREIGVRPLIVARAGWYSAVGSQVVPRRLLEPAGIAPDEEGSTRAIDAGNRCAPEVPR